MAFLILLYTHSSHDGTSPTYKLHSKVDFNFFPTEASPPSKPFPSSKTTSSVKKNTTVSPRSSSSASVAGPNISVGVGSPVTCDLWHGAWRFFFWLDFWWDYFDRKQDMLFGAWDLGWDLLWGILLFEGKLWDLFVGHVAFRGQTTVWSLFWVELCKALKIWYVYIYIFLYLCMYLKKKYIYIYIYSMNMNLNMPLSPSNNHRYSFPTRVGASQPKPSCSHPLQNNAGSFNSFRQFSLCWDS